MVFRGAALVGLATFCGLSSRLYLLDQPPTPVFDEYHVGRFVVWFDEGMDSFDLHPPLLKMLYQSVSRGLGHGGRADCSYGAADPFVADHTVPFETCSMWELRLTPAVCGGLLAPVFMLTATLLGVRWPAALLGTLLLLCDNMFFGLSRLHMLDMGTMLLVALIVLVAVGTQHAGNLCGPGAVLPSMLLVLNGVLLGLALASKFAMALPTIAWLGIYNITVLRHHAHAAVAAIAQTKVQKQLDARYAENTLDYEPEDGVAVASLRWLVVDTAVRGVGLLGGAAFTYIGVMWVHFSRVPMRHWKSDHYALAGPPYDDSVPCGHCVPPLSGAAEHATFWFFTQVMSVPIYCLKQC